MCVGIITSVAFRYHKIRSKSLISRVEHLFTQTVKLGTRRSSRRVLLSQIQQNKFISRIDCPPALVLCINKRKRTCSSDLFTDHFRQNFNNSQQELKLGRCGAFGIRSKSRDISYVNLINAKLIMRMKSLQKLRNIRSLDKFSNTRPR